MVDLIYRISIHKTQSGTYEFSTYHKDGPREFPDFPSVVSSMIRIYHNGLMPPKFWQDDPLLVDLSENEQHAINAVRAVLVRQNELEMKVKSADDDEIPF